MLNITQKKNIHKWLFLVCTSLFQFHLQAAQQKNINIQQIHNKIEFEQKVINASEPVVLKFFADWCPPCKRVKSIVNAVAQGYKNVKFFEINIDTCPELSTKYQIRSIPTLIFLHGPIQQKKEVKRIIGANMNKSSLNHDIKRAFFQLK